MYANMFYVEVSLQEYIKIVNLLKSKFSTCFLFSVYFIQKISHAPNFHFKSQKKRLNR